ncbi:hypothetical protein LSUE1_G004210 [Lachnellula suecica]|uniref:Aminoglycoside phosphotransferase domain-containing protein n=1 Tax=Lachnellula suecica TaxID=602035 RepID=A0A8T9C620_9HELO|nr:hypothetical protein LSUE1_G004210 [Lachnellula suecica]
MSATLELDNGDHITYELARKKDVNIINETTYPKLRKRLFQELWEQQAMIRALVRHHLSLRDEDVCIIEDQWIRGNFNVCIPVQVRSASFNKKLMFRCPMPHKLAEARYPGTVDEKLSSEVGTYIWMQEHCLDIPIPQLYGFGFSDNRHFIHEQRMPFYSRFWRRLQRCFRNYFRYPHLSQYAFSPTSLRLPTAYMLLEHIGPDIGEELSDTWNELRKDPVQRQNLFRGMARVMLSLARIPQRRIGSFEFHNNGTITLTNRPLPCSVIVLENDGAPRTISRNETYTSTEPFVADMLKLYDDFFLTSPNAVSSMGDCLGQMAAKAMLRALSHHYIQRESRNGPYRLQLTDFHASNIFIDKVGNITCLIDHEWVCALPVEMLSVPYWLTGCAIDDITEEKLCEFEIVHREFMEIFEEEEVKMMSTNLPAITRIMHNSWKSGGVWFWHCITSVNAAWSLFDDHIGPRYLPLSTDSEGILSQYWCQGSSTVANRKVAEREEYEKQLQVLFDEKPAHSPEGETCS